jgi:hypothetical protein
MPNNSGWSLNQSHLPDIHEKPGRQTNVAAAHPEMVAKLEAAAGRARAGLGDSLTKRAASNIRPPVRIK